MFKNGANKQLESYGYGLNARLVSGEIEANALDDSGDCSTQVDLEDLPA
jgi:hypothetical protein